MPFKIMATALDIIATLHHKITLGQVQACMGIIYHMSLLIELLGLLTLLSVWKLGQTTFQSLSSYT